MPSLNKVMLIGHIGQDPEVTSGSKCDIARFSVATQRGFAKDAETDWHRCVCFDDDKINFIEDYVHKGDLVLVEGSIKYGSYENKNGDKVYTSDVIVYRIDKLKDASDNGGGGRQNDRRSRRSRNDDDSDRGSRSGNSRNRRQAEPMDDPGDDDLPF